MKVGRHRTVFIKMKKLIILLCITLVMPVAAIAEKIYAPADMPNVQVANRSEYVSDPGNLVSASTKRQVNESLAEIRRQTTCEVVVAVPPSIGDAEPAEWSEQLFTLWKIGKKDKDNGVLIMISPDSHAWQIMTGYGTEGVLPDIACATIGRRTIVPEMRDNDDLDAAVASSVKLVGEALTDPAVAEELRSSQADYGDGDIEPLDEEVFFYFFLVVSGAMCVASLIVFCHDWWVNRRRDRFYKAEAWRKHIPLYLIMGVISFGPGLIFALLAWIKYRLARVMPRKCDTCGAKMHRLPEDKDNEYLTDSQDFEENLNTVDYDVWECPKCGTVERFPFKVKQTKYTECPQCHTIAMTEIRDNVIVPATTRHAGEGEKVYECKYCHHQHRKRYTIPRKEDASAAVLGAAIGAAAASGRRGGGGFGGGGFGGGGFGGGMTGGGGAGGRW